MLVDVSMTELDGIKNKLINYYANKERDQTLNIKLNSLMQIKDRLLSELEHAKNKLQNDDIDLEVNLQNVVYENTRITKTVNKSSPQDKAIDFAYVLLQADIRNLSYKITNTMLEIEEVVKLITKVSNENLHMDIIIDSINDKEIKNILMLKYKYNQSYMEIAFELNRDISTISRRLKKYLKYIQDEYDKFEKYNSILQT